MLPKDSFSAIILAAGLSSRMGRSKQLIKIDEVTMLDRAIEAALTAGLVSPIVVLGHSAAEITSQTVLLNQCKVVINDLYRSGMSTSLKCGIEASPPQNTAYVFMLADQPLVTGALIKELLKGFEENQADILYPVYRKRRGNPVIISAKLRNRLMEAKGDEGARFLFSASDLTVVPYPVTTSAVITDIDTPDDVQRVINSLSLGKD
jgi:molybdenum cofactor cytidylyltransferase